MKTHLQFQHLHFFWLLSPAVLLFNLVLISPALATVSLEVKTVDSEDANQNSSTSSSLVSSSSRSLSRDSTQPAIAPAPQLQNDLANDNLTNAIAIQSNSSELNTSDATDATSGAIAVIDTATEPLPEQPSNLIISQTNPSQTNPQISPRPSQITSQTATDSASNFTNYAELDQQSMGQVTSVSQLSDVQPTDWAFQALQSLVERYGVIAGYPDGTYRGNRALTRYEFAAGLNAALDRVNELIAAGLADTVTQEDLATLQRLQEEFAAELATLRGRVDVLEARTSELEANQFSTTTRLQGETIFGLVSPIDGESADGDPVPRNLTFGYRVRLNLETSFTGEDLLTTRLQANNITPLGGTNSGVLGTNEGRVEFDGDSNNQVSLSLLRYRFPISSQTNFYLAGTGNGFVDLDASAQLTPYLDGTAVSLFGLRNPIYNYPGGAGFGLRHLFNDNFELNLGYLTPEASDPTLGSGLFNGKYGALAQLIFYGGDRLRLGFSYINAYSPSEDEFGTSTGSNLSNSDFGRAVVANAYGISGTFDITPGIALGGWVGYSHHRYIGAGDGEVWTWAAALSFPDLGNEGSIGGILVGMEPRLTELDSSVNDGVTDPDVSLHIEAFYRYRLSDNVDITPGVIWTTAPDHNADNEDVIIGVLRTRFFF